MYATGSMTSNTGIKGAIDFLRKNLQVEALNNLPYPASLVPLAVFFAVKSVSVTDAQRSALVKWFWRSCFSRRYSAGVIRNLNKDIEEAAALREGRSSMLADFPASVDKEFFEQTFTIGTVNTRTFILLLAHERPLIPAAKLRFVLDRALCPEELFDDDYDKFVSARSARLVEAARALI